MILKSLTLRNFRKFKNATIEFPDGVTGVVGLNGAGKSTIFEAIAWVLYGSVAARTSSDEIKRQDAEASDPCRIELEFVFENNNYRVIREMTGKSLTASATATVNGKIAATSAETVSKYIQKKLGMDFKSFFTSIFAKQKELNTLSSMNASERRPLILRMLGIDSLDEVIKEIKSDKKNKDLLIEKLGSDLIDDSGHDKIDIYKVEIKNLEKEKSNNESLIKKSKEKIFFFKKGLGKLEKDCENTKKEYEKIQIKKEKLAGKKILFENKEKLADELKILKNKISEREKTIIGQKKKLSSFSKLDNDLKSSEKRLDELDKKIKDYIKKIEQKNTIENRIKQDIKNVNSKKEKIEKIGPNAKCPTCERVLADQYNTLISKFLDEVSNKEKEIEKLKKEIKTVEEEKNRFSREEIALQKKQNYLQDQSREKERIETTIKNIHDEIKQEKNELENKEKKFKEFKLIDFDRKEYETVIKQVGKFYSKYQQTIKKRDDKKDEINSLNLELERKESDKKLILQKVDNFKEKITNLEKAKKKIKEEKIVTQHLGMLNEVMTDFRTHLISRIRPTLSNYSSDFFERLTDGKYHQLELDENYNLLIYDNGQAYSIERFSGGEEDLANLCLRLAISEVITERAGGVFNFIILDEIFGSQDYIRRHNIMKALNLLSSKFRQIFLITHVDDVKDDMENVISVIENEDGNSNAQLK